MRESRPERRLMSRMGRALETSDPATLLASLARNIPGAIYRCALDHDWTMHLIGEEIERITGYPPEDFIENRRRTFASLIHIEDRDRVEETVWEAVRAGRPFELEYRVLSASGDVRWVLERGCAVRGGQQEWLDRIIFDITERHRFEEAARHAEAEAAVARELAEARKRIVYAGDEARRRIERDLHDGAQQSFVCALMTLASAQRNLGKSRETAAALLQTTHEHLERGLNDLRDLARGMHPSLLATHGIAAAVGALGARIPVPVTIVDDLDDRVAPAVESALYFSAAEAITNAAKHARASEICVHVGRENGCVFVEVTDDGVGGASFDHGSGLPGLSDRLSTVGGTVDLASRAGAATRLVARIPVVSNEDTVP
jgi:PAS domain S-box-containing protein